MENRRSDRRKTLLSAKILSSGGIDDCVVHDLSIGGAEIRTIAALQASQKVTLEMPRIGEIPARVAWTSENLIGIQFLEDLEDEALSTLVQGKGAAQEPKKAAAPVATGNGGGEPSRADAEERLIEVARRLSADDLEIAIAQMDVLARRGEPRP